MHRLVTQYKDFSPEHEFLLALLAGGESCDLADRAAQLDWEHFFDVTPADLYGYMGYRLTEAGVQDHCPSKLFDQTRNARRAIAAQWLRLKIELRNVAASFEAQHVDFLLLKGAVLAFNAYPDCSLRPVSDIDLLVRPESLNRALGCIYATGFKCPERIQRAHPLSFTDSALLGENVSLPLQKDGTRAVIEVHTQLESAEPWFPMSVAQMWQSSQEQDVGGLRVHTLEPREFLFHLILHLARAHVYSLGLRPLLDVHLWIQLQSGHLDWQWIGSECLRRGYTEWAHLTLRLVRDLFGTNVPASFFKTVPPPIGLDHLAHLALQQIWANRRLDSLVPPRLAITLSQPSLWGAISTLFTRLKPTGRPAGNATIPAMEQSKSRGLLAGLHALKNDLSLKMPQYVRAWHSGSLRWSNLMEAARLAKGRVEIKRTMENVRPAFSSLQEPRSR
jgi:hypothetical protein